KRIRVRARPDCRGYQRSAGPEVMPREKAAEGYGRSYPIGATIVPSGTNFSVFSREASSVELLLFEEQDDLRAARVISLDPARNRTYYYWHAFVPGVSAGQIYG